MLAISWSSLQRYEYCHQKQLRTSEGKSVSAKWYGRDVLAGNVADRAMRYWLSNDPQPGQLAEITADYFDRFTNVERGEEDFAPVRWKGNPIEDRRKVFEFTQLVVARLEPILLRLVIPHAYQPEVRFRTIVQVPYLDGDLVPIVLRGGIDIATQLWTDLPEYGLSAGEYVLFDLKATKNDSYIAKTLGQGIFYTLAWKSYLGLAEYPRRFAFIAPALDEQVIWTDIDEEDRRVMWTRIARFAQGMWHEDYEPKTDDEGCDYCEVRHACKKFAAHIEIDDKGRALASFEEAAASRRTYQAPAESEVP